MKRSVVRNNSNDNNRISNNHKQQQQRKRSLEDNGQMIKSKKRRHLSPQYENRTKVSSSAQKKSKKRLSGNDSTAETTNNNSQTSRKSSSRRQSFSTEHLSEITLPNWECISPNIDQILSNKHTQSGVYAHEVHLVQQELEALLSMSVVRENLLQDLLHPSKPLNNDNIRSKIRQHQQAEYFYSSKKPPKKKPLPPLINQSQLRHNAPNLLLDRQVSLAPVMNARIDKIWSDIQTYYSQISSQDILTIRNLLGFNERLEEKIQQYKTEYKNNILTEANITEQLNEENFQELTNISEISPLITHYVDGTTIGRFQTKLYEHIPHTSPIYKTPISSPFYRKSVGNHLDHNSSLRSSPRLHSNYRMGPVSSSNTKSNDDQDKSVVPRLKKNTRLTSTSPPSSIQIQERIQLVHDYLSDQHPVAVERVKRQLFNDIKSTKKRKTSMTIHNDFCTDKFESKLSTLISLLHESSTLSSCALHRAHLQSNHEQTLQKLNTIERDLEVLIQKIDMTGGTNISSVSTEKTLDHLLQDWNKCEDEFHQQLQQLRTDK